ncbi:hypothetical protein OH764_00725 [Burkholderia sp. M6-3]
MEETTTKNMTPEEISRRSRARRKEALERALDTRQFEIDLYWKRATYFWTFIGATLAGFIAIQAGNSPRREILPSCCRALASVLVRLVACQSRKQYWQENWEKHVDLLEDYETGHFTRSRFSAIRP